MGSGQYVKNVKAALVCSKSTRADLTKIIQNDVDAFVLEHPDATEQDLIGQFGTPNELAASYIDSMVSSEIHEQFKVAKKRKRRVLLCCCLAIVATLSFAIYVLFTVVSQTPAYQVETIEQGERVYTDINSSSLD